MDRIVASVILLTLINQQAKCNNFDITSITYENRTDPATRQLYEFRQSHTKPLGLLTTSSGLPVEIRDTNTLNSDLLSNEFFLDSLLHIDSENIPERIVHAKGAGAIGYFEVTNDVSKYTKADVFNKIGKKTPIVARFSPVFENRGGTDVDRETRGLAVKFYTREGNLDFLCINFPAFFLKDPQYFNFFVHALKRNPKTDLFDNVAKADFFSLRSETTHAALWFLSDYGIPNGYRKMDAFPTHTYEVINKNGERHYVKFNFRTEQGIENLPSDEATRISGEDPDYFKRDLYNAIENKNYPVWKLEMYVLSYKEILKLNYDPFDLTVLWKKGTYRTVEIGRLVLTKNPHNAFRITEQSAFNPGNLVPGIPGPIDNLFKARRFSYKDTQNYRLGVNHNKIEVNCPIYTKVYNRDGVPPVKDNMRDAPNYYPNSFNGPVSYVDASKPQFRFDIIQSDSTDLGESSYFYNHVLESDQHRKRLANNTVNFLLQSPPFIQRRFIKLFYLIDPHLGNDLDTMLHETLKRPTKQKVRVLKIPRDLCY